MLRSREPVTTPCHRRGRPGWALLTTAGMVSLALSGCGTLRLAYAPERSSRHTITQSSDVPETEPAAAVIDSTRPADPTLVVVEPRPGRRQPIADRPAAEPSRSSAAADTTGREALAADSIQAPPPPISMVVPEAEKRQLVKSTLKALDEATTILRRVGGRLESAEAVEKRQTVQGLIDQSREALGRDDVGAAASLARKARILAIELLSLR